MKAIFATVVMLTIFLVQAYSPVVAQDKAEEPEAKEAAEKPAWDDGGRAAMFIRHFQNAGKFVEGSELTQSDIDLFCKHTKGFNNLVKKNTTPKMPEMAVDELVQVVNKSEWYKKWCTEKGIEKPERWMPISIKIAIHQIAGNMEKKVKRKLTKAKETLVNAEGIKDAMPKEYAKAEARVVLLKAQFQAISDLPSLTESDMKLIDANIEAIEEASSYSSEIHKETPEEKAMAEIAGNNVPDSSQSTLDVMREASYWIQIHDDPEVGQYWLTVSEMSGMKMFNRWQVVKIDGDTAIVENASCMAGEHIVSHYVLAYEVDLKAAIGKANVTKAWKGLPGSKPVKMDVMTAPGGIDEDEDEAEDDFEMETEDFEGLELAGGTWSGKLYITEYSTVWMADNGWFNKVVKIKVGEYVTELLEYGDDCQPLLDWDDE